MLSSGPHGTAAEFLALSGGQRNQLPDLPRYCAAVTTSFSKHRGAFVSIDKVTTY